MIDGWEIVVMLLRWNAHYSEILAPLRNSTAPVSRGVTDRLKIRLESTLIHV